MMNLWEMIVIVVLIGAVVTVAKFYFASKHGTEVSSGTIWDELGLSDSKPAERDVKKHLDRIRTLEERVQVLERIATDKGQNLKDQINSL